MASNEAYNIVVRIYSVYLMVSMAAQPALIIINYLNSVYQVQAGEPISFTHYYFYDKLFTIVALTVLKAIITKYRNILIPFFINFLIVVIYFEYLSTTRPKFMAFFTFLILLTFNKILSFISEIKLITYTIANATMLIYVIIRTIIFKHQDNTFPLFYSIVLIIDYIITEIPIHFLFYNYGKLSTYKNNTIQDFKTIINLIPNPIIIYDDTLKTIVLTNQATNTKFNQPAINSMLEVATQNAIPSQELKFTTMGFTYTITTCRFDTTSFENKPIIISIVDITGISRQERKEANEEATWLFINAANHQIRTPLSGIESSLILLQDAIDSDDKSSIKTNIDIVTISVVGLRHLIDDTLLLCEDKENKIVINNELFKMSEVITFLKQMFAFETYKKNLKLSIEGYDSSLLLFGDKKRITHIIYTLISNAFKYTLHGEIAFKYRVNNNLQSTMLEMEISDTGLGIDNEDIKRIFNVFDDIYNKKSEENVSTGISLHIVKRLCQLMGGEIALRSEIGKGTVFSFSIPVSTSIGNQHLIVKPPELQYVLSQTSLNADSPSVLLVDDNTTNLFVLSAMLTKLKIIFDVAHNGEEAVNKFKDGYYRLVLMDINMPIMNGYEASKRIKEIKKSKKHRSVVVALSAQNMPGNDSMLKENGIEKWIIKPVSMNVLKLVLQDNGLIEQIVKN